MLFLISSVICLILLSLLLVFLSNTYKSFLSENNPKIAKYIEKNNKKSVARQKFHFWRLFYIACAEIFGYDNGNEWIVSHHLFGKSKK